MFQPKATLLLLLLSGLFFSCEKTMLTAEEASLPSAQFLGMEGLHYPAQTCGTSAPIDLVDASNNVWGNVTLVHDQQEIYFLVSLQPGKYLTRSEVFAGKTVDIPTTPAGHLISYEQFPHQVLLPRGATTYTLIIPQSGLGICTDVLMRGRIASKDFFGNMGPETEIFMKGQPYLDGQKAEYCLAVCPVTPGNLGTFSFTN